MRQLIVYLCIAMFSIMTLGCGDDSSDNNAPTKQQDDKEKEKEKEKPVDLVLKSVDVLNLSIDTMIDTHCTCTSTTPDDIAACFKAMREPTIELSDCDTTAAVCNADSYLDFQNCQIGAYKTIIECLESCPSSAEHSKCIDKFQTDREACMPLFTTELINDFQTCSAGETPTC